MIIREQQEEALRRSFAESFENRMLGYAREFFPAFAANQQTARDVIRVGIERAQRYGLVSERDVCLFLNLLFSFGPDADIAKPWASAILTYPMLTDPAQKAMWLQEAAEAHLVD